MKEHVVSMTQCSRTWIGQKRVVLRNRALRKSWRNLSYNTNSIQINKLIKKSWDQRMDVQKALQKCRMRSWTTLNIIKHKENVIINSIRWIPEVQDVRMICIHQVSSGWSHRGTCYLQQYGFPDPESVTVPGTDGSSLETTMKKWKNETWRMKAKRTKFQVNGKYWEK